MNQELRKLMYHSEEVLMNNNFSLDKVNKFKKYWKQFKDYCEDNDILSLLIKLYILFYLNNIILILVNKRYYQKKKIKL